MSDRWFYRVFGQEFGPVSLDLVRTLVASGTIAPDDEVRDATRSNWILACAATELRDSNKSSDLELAVERRGGRDEWFCQGVSGDFGPLTLSELIQLAAEGELKSDEVVKARADDYWKQICSIRRLVELLPFPDRVNKSDRTDLDSAQIQVDRDRECEMDILLFPGVQSIGSSDWKGDEMERSFETLGKESCVPNSRMPDHNDVHCSSETDSTSQFATSFAPAVHSPHESGNVFGSLEVLSPIDGDDSSESLDQLEAALSIGDAKWTGWIAGAEFGPVDYSELLNWAVTGRLSPMDFVRRGEEGQYVPAVNVPCLFTVRAAASSLTGSAKTLTAK